MASKRQRTRADGTVAWQALYRHHGRQRSATFDTAAARDQWVKLVDDVGLEAALEVLDVTESGGGRGAPTLREYALAEIEARTGIGEGTRHRYRREVERDWGVIGALPINLVTEAHVQRWVRDLERAGASAKTIRNKHGFLFSVLERAVRDKAIDLHANPCAETALRKDDVRAEMTFLTHDEFAVLLGCVPPPYRPFVSALFGTGARFGEVTALEVGDYDSATRSLRIARAWKRQASGWAVGPPKTKRGRRTVGVPEQLVDYCERMRAERAPSDLLFQRPRGGRIKHSTFYPEVWAPAVRLANGLPGWPEKGEGYTPSARSMWHGIGPLAPSLALGKTPRIHDARHSAASWLLAAGATLQDVQYTLGHESVQTTADRYGHLLPGRREAVAAAMTAALSPALPQIES